MAFGKGNIKLHSCLNIGNVFVKFAEPSEQIQPIGGFVGGISDTVYTITVENSIQSGSVTVENNYTNNPIALLIGSADGGVTLKCVVINGKVISNDTNVYKISSSEKIAIENTVINVQFEKRTIFDDISLPPIIVPHFNSIDKTENTDINGIPSEQQEELNLLSYNAILASATVDIELKIANCESFLKENDTLDERKKDVLMKIQKTQEKIAALKIPKKRMLGSDYKKCDYFYFRATHGKIFRKDKQNKKWYILDNKTDLEELTNKLCEKGLKEKR